MGRACSACSLETAASEKGERGREGPGTPLATYVFLRGPGLQVSPKKKKSSADADDPAIRFPPSLTHRCIIHRGVHRSIDERGARIAGPAPAANVSEPFTRPGVIGRTPWPVGRPLGRRARPAPPPSRPPPRPPSALRGSRQSSGVRGVRGERLRGRGR